MKLGKELEFSINPLELPIKIQKQIVLVSDLEEWL